MERKYLIHEVDLTKKTKRKLRRQLQMRKVNEPESGKYTHEPARIKGDR